MSSPSPFLRHAWYVAGWDHEVTHQPRASRVLGQDLVLYRDEGGRPAALEDLCPHRSLPLSMGRVRGGAIECGYHGLCFDRTGACVHMPGVERIPKAVHVRSFPAESRYGLVWVWMGLPAAADPRTIFPVAHWDEAGWGRNEGGSMTLECDYRHVNDNLLDPSHVAWVHRGSFGNTACEDRPVETTETPGGVIAARWMDDVPVAPFYRPFVGFAGHCDRLQHYEVRFPSHALIRAIFVPAGAAGAQAEAHPQAMIMDSYNFMTPQDADHTRYYWFQIRNFAPYDAIVSRQLDVGIEAAFAEDKVILNAVHRGHRGRFAPAIALPGDRAGILFRRRLQALIEAEQPAATALSAKPVS